MTEEEQKPEEQKPEEQKPVEGAPEWEKNKLDDLPEDARFDLHYLIKMGFGVHKIKDKFEAKWDGKTDLVPASHNTYLSYRKIHKETIDQQKLYDDIRADAAKESFQEMAGLFDVDTIDNPDAVKEHFDALRKLCLSRIKFIQREQERGFADPRSESNLNSYLKDLMKLSEMYMKYRDEIEDDRQSDLDEYMKRMFYELMNGFIIIVKKYHGNDKLTEMVNDFHDHVEELQLRALHKANEDDKPKN